MSLWTDVCVCVCVYVHRKMRCTWIWYWTMSLRRSTRRSDITVKQSKSCPFSTQRWANQLDWCALFGILNIEAGPVLPSSALHVSVVSVLSIHSRQWGLPQRYQASEPAPQPWNWNPKTLRLWKVRHSLCVIFGLSYASLPLILNSFLVCVLLLLKSWNLKLNGVWCSIWYLLRTEQDVLVVLPPPHHHPPSSTLWFIGSDILHIILLGSRNCALAR